MRIEDADLHDGNGGGRGDADAASGGDASGGDVGDEKQMMTVLMPFSFICG